MTQVMTRDDARDALAAAIHAVAPEADLATLGPEENIREAFELDSLDFLAVVEHLADRAGRRIEEDDYDRLSTLDSAVDFLATGS
jgi:acyl carrier protein